MPETQVLGEQALGTLGCELEQSSSGAMRVIVTGELDLATAPVLERALHHAHDTGGRPIVLDLSGVSFCDSTGLNLIVRASQRARDERRRLVIVRGSDQVQRLFALTGVDEQLEIVEDAAMATGGSSDPKLAARRSR